VVPSVAFARCWWRVIRRFPQPLRVRGFEECARKQPPFVVNSAGGSATRAEDVCQAGSLTGAVHPSKDNAGVLRPAQPGRKPGVEQKGKSWLDSGFSVRIRTVKAWPIDPFARPVREPCAVWSSERCQKNYHRDNWLVAAKRS
jgi:hypothetical protein